MIVCSTTGMAHLKKQIWLDSVIAAFEIVTTYVKAFFFSLSSRVVVGVFRVTGTDIFNPKNAPIIWE